MKVVTWNVNGIRSLTSVGRQGLKGFLELFPDAGMWLDWWEGAQLQLHIYLAAAFLRSPMIWFRCLPRRRFACRHCVCAGDKAEAHRADTRCGSGRWMVSEFG